MSGEARSKAAEVLKLPADASAEVAICAFLAGLPTTEFVPSDEAAVALNTLTSLHVPVGANTSAALREDVEAFARRYWSLSPAGRRAEWRVLSNRSPDDATAARLLALQAGLELPGTPVKDESIEEVLELTRELYVQEPRERAIRRNDWLMANAARHGVLIAVGAAIQRIYPAYTLLEPALFYRLTSDFQASVFADAAKAEPLPGPASGSSRTNDFTLSTNSVASMPAYPKPTPQPEKNDGGWKLGWQAYAGIFCAIRMIIALAQTSYPNPQAPYSLPQTPNIPSALPQSSPLPWTFTAEQVRECQEYEASTKNGDLTKLPPFNYAAWLLAGKPTEAQVVYKNLKNKSKETQENSQSQSTQMITFSREEIERFKKYELMRGLMPAGYEKRLAAGKPQ